VKQEGLYWVNPGFNQTDQHPVTTVSWNRCRGVLPMAERKERAILIGLPTEAEWDMLSWQGARQLDILGMTLRKCANMGM